MCLSFLFFEWNCSELKSVYSDHLVIIYYMFFCNNSCWVANVGNTWVCKGLNWIAHLVMFVRVVCSHGLVELVNSLVWLVKVVDVGLVYWTTINQSFDFFLNPLLGWRILSFSLNKPNFHPMFLKLPKSFNLLFTSLTQTFRDPTNGIRASLLIIG